MKLTFEEDDLESLATLIAGKINVRIGDAPAVEVVEEEDDLTGGGGKLDEPAVTLEQVQDAIRKGCEPTKKTDKAAAKAGVVAILKKHEVKAATELKPDQYAAVLAELDAYAKAKK